jgi:hypothetical protein
VPPGGKSAELDPNPNLKKKAGEDQEELLKNVQGREEYPTYRKKKDR